MLFDPLSWHMPERKIFERIISDGQTGTDHGALEFPNTEEAIKYMTKVSENTQKNIYELKQLIIHRDWS